MIKSQLSADFGNDTISWPTHHDNQYFWSNSGDAFILSKCNGCGHGQDWANGNSYYTMYNDKTYYCSTASSLWETAERMTDHKHSF